MRRLIEEAEIAELTRRLAEAQYAVGDLRRRLEGADGPLAVLAQLRLARVEDTLTTDLASLAQAAPLLLAVTDSRADDALSS